MCLFSSLNVFFSSLHKHWTSIYRFLGIEHNNIRHTSTLFPIIFDNLLSLYYCSFVLLERATVLLLSLFFLFFFSSAHRQGTIAIESTFCRCFPLNFLNSTVEKNNIRYRWWCDDFRKLHNKNNKLAQII